MDIASWNRSELKWRKAMCLYMFFYFGNTTMWGEILVDDVDRFVYLDTIITTDIIAYRSKVRIENITGLRVIIYNAIIFK